MLDSIIKELETIIKTNINTYIEPIKDEYKLSALTEKEVTTGYIEYTNMKPVQLYIMPDKANYDRISVSTYEQRQAVDIWIIVQRATQADMYLQACGYFRSLFETLMMAELNYIDEIEVGESEYLPDISGDENRKAMRLSISIKSEIN